MVCDPIGMCELLVGLGEVDVLSVDDDRGGPLRLSVRSRTARPSCAGCGGKLWSKGDRAVELVDLPSFGRPARLVWHKHRWRCPSEDCGTGSTTEHNPQVAPPRALLTTRAARWATRQVGCGRPVSDVASELGCCWSAVNDTVLCWGQTLLDADTDRIGATTAVGLDETLFGRTGRYRHKAWATSIVDVAGGKLLDIVPHRTAAAPAQWLLDRPQSWREKIRWAALDLSGPYRATLDTALPDARQVADPFHVVRLANNTLDEVRRRVQNQTLGHRGRKHDPLYASRKLLLTGHERISETGEDRLRGLLESGDPHGEVRNAWHANQTLRGIYDIADPDLGAKTVDQLAVEFQDSFLPVEVNRLGRTLARWSTQIANWHHARVSNAASEAANNLIKRVKRVGFGFSNFTNYRIRALLYAGKPNWNLLNTLTPT